MGESTNDESREVKGESGGSHADPKPPRAPKPVQGVQPLTADDVPDDLR